MSADSVIQVERLGKRYALGVHTNGRYVALRDVIADSARKLLRRGERTRVAAGGNKEFWALQDVSFEIGRGEVVGIIGRNGAGKSTLLKILSRITEPTTGRIRLKGRVASLLEVGTGFHPELTGRENIFLNGAILGMHRSEIKAKFDEIVAFAEVEKFLDTPVKRYSSGMYVRLAFAVAAHLEPEVLVVDEVLAVGDAKFQKKCLGKMQEVSNKGGRTVLFVSHQMSAVENLCTRSIMLEAGTVQFDGSTREAIRCYLDAMETGAASLNIRTLRRRGEGMVRLTGFMLEDETARQVVAVSSGDKVNIVLEYESRPGATINQLSVGLSIHDQRGDMLSVFYSDYEGQLFSDVPPQGRLTCTVPDFPFSPGRYYIGARVLVNGVEADWPQDFVGSIDVEAGDFYGSGAFGQHSLGPILLRGHWQLQNVYLPSSNVP